MNKKNELNAFLSVFRTSPSLKIIEHERPDFLLKETNIIQLGVEVTEIYSNQTDAKLKNLDGYSTGLVNETIKVHKKDEENINVGEAKLIDEKGKERKEIQLLLFFKNIHALMIKLRF